MTLEQLAHRLGVAKTTVQDLERSEARGAISIKSLERVGKALGCRLSYTLIPEQGSLEAIVDARAASLARRRLARVTHSMELEGQGSSSAVNESQVRQLAAEIKAKLPSEIWEPE
jgi:predicted DNA-binding mobile mystery protein A